MRGAGAQVLGKFRERPERRGRHVSRIGRNWLSKCMNAVPAGWPLSPSRRAGANAARPAGVARTRPGRKQGSQGSLRRFALIEPAGSPQPAPPRRHWPASAAASPRQHAHGVGCSVERIDRRLRAPQPRGPPHGGRPFCGWASRRWLRAGPPCDAGDPRIARPHHHPAEACCRAAAARPIAACSSRPAIASSVPRATAVPRASHPPTTPAPRRGEAARQPAVRDGGLRWGPGAAPQKELLPASRSHSGAPARQRPHGCGPSPHRSIAEPSLPAAALPQARASRRSTPGPPGTGCWSRSGPAATWTRPPRRRFGSGSSRT